MSTPTLDSRAGRWAVRGSAVAILLAGSLTLTTLHHSRGSEVTPQAAAATASQAADAPLRTVAASRSDGSGRVALKTRKVRVTVDGTTTTVATPAKDVRGVLQQAGVVLAAGDVVSPDLDSTLRKGEHIVVGRPVTSVQTKTEVQKHDVVETTSDSLPKGERRVTRQGHDGTVVSTYSVQKLHGKKVSRHLVTQSVTAHTVDELVTVGTGSKAKAAKKASKKASKTSAPTSVPSGSTREIGKKLAAKRGWGDDQFSCLNSLWTRESGWRVNAANSSSGAYGIPQANPGSKMASVGSDWRTNPATQITWGLNYIAGRYGTPCGAWSHFTSSHWY